MTPEPKSSPLRMALRLLALGVNIAFSVGLWLNMLQPLAVIGGFVCLAGAILICRGAIGQ